VSHYDSIFFRKMLTSAPGALVKEANIVKFYWKLCSQPLKNIKSVIFYAEFSSFGILNKFLSMCVVAVCPVRSFLHYTLSDD
jgi:hypothetical protein